MTPLDYGPDWRHPARTVVQARCSSHVCTPDGLPGALVMASTLDDRGFCAACRREVAEPTLFGIAGSRRKESR